MQSCLLNKDIFNIVSLYIWKYRINRNNTLMKMQYYYMSDSDDEDGEGLMYSNTFMYAFNYRPEYYYSKICHFDIETEYELPENYW